MSSSILYVTTWSDTYYAMPFNTQVETNLTLEDREWDRNSYKINDTYRVTNLNPLPVVLWVTCVTPFILEKGGHLYIYHYRTATGLLRLCKAWKRGSSWWWVGQGSCRRRLANSELHFHERQTLSYIIYRAAQGFYGSADGVQEVACSTAIAPWPTPTLSHSRNGQFLQVTASGWLFTQISWRVHHTNVQVHECSRGPGITP